MSLHVHGVPGSVLAAGEQGAVVLSEHGRVLASFDLPLRPSQRLVVADFNGDGLNDIIEVTAMGVFGWAQVCVALCCTLWHALCLHALCLR